MCDCIDKVNEKLKQHNLAVTVPLLIGGNNVGSIKTIVVTHKIDGKKRSKKINLFASYCPFCGEKYPN